MLFRSIIALGLIVASAQMVQARTSVAPQMAATSTSEAMAGPELPSSKAQVQPDTVKLARLMSTPSIGTDGVEEEYHEHTPGWTGHTIVHGSNSTLAGSDDATEWQKTGFFR